MALPVLEGRAQVSMALALPVARATLREGAASPRASLPAQGPPLWMCGDLDAALSWGHTPDSPSPHPHPRRLSPATDGAGGQACQREGRVGTGARDRSASSPFLAASAVVCPLLRVGWGWGPGPEMGKAQLPTLPPWMQQTSGVRAWGWAEPRVLEGPGCRHSRQDPAGRQGLALTSVLCLGHGQGVCLCVCLGVYICLCMHPCAYVHACTCMYICVHVCLCECTVSVGTCVCVPVCACTCICVHMCLCACVCGHVCACMPVCACLCVHMCVATGAL